MSRSPLPVIIEPFSTFADEIAGETADEIAANLLACTRYAIAYNLKPKRPLYTLRQLRDFFRGHELTEANKIGCREVANTYARIIARQERQERDRQKNTPYGA